MESLKLRLQNAIPVNGVSAVSSEAGVMVGCNGETYFLPSGKDEWVKVENIPAVNVNCHTPAKRGHWTNGECKCPVCGEDKFKDLDADIWSDWKPPFCPNCGADMRGEEKMTDRLTKRGSFTQRDVDKLFDLTDENPMGRTEAYIKLQQYEDLEDFGLLPRLPIRVPGTIYRLVKRYTACTPRKLWFDEEECDHECPYIHTDKCDSKKYYTIKEEYIRSVSSLAFVWGTIGKTRFATKEEAEARIKQLENGEVGK